MNDFDWTSLINPALQAGANYWASKQVGKAGERAAGQADPFAQYRPQYANALAELQRDPSRVQKTPGYRFAFDQGQQALERSAAAKGFTGSGNVLTELINYGQGMAEQQFGKERDFLAKASGAYLDPSVAAKMGLDSRMTQLGGYNQAAGELISGAGGGTNSLATLYKTGKGLYDAYKAGSALTGGSGTSAVVQGGSELGAGTGGAFDQWASTQAGYEGLGGPSMGDAATMSSIASEGGLISGGAYGAGQTAGNYLLGGGLGIEGGTVGSSLYAPMATEAAIDAGALGGAAAEGSAAAGASTTAAGSIPASYFLGPIGAMIAYSGFRDATEAKNMYEGGNRTLERLRSLGVTPEELDVTKMFSIVTPQNVERLGGEGSDSTFSSRSMPRAVLNDQYWNYLRSKYPGIDQQIGLGDLQGDFTSVFGQRFAQQSPEYQAWANALNASDNSGGG